MRFPVPPPFPARDLIFQFFWSFATFECAMKRAGLCKAGPYHMAEPNWRAFEEGIRETALGSESFKVAAKALIELAPKCQVVDAGKLGWETAEQGQADVVGYALFLLRTVRNNLFHGGKYEHGGPIQDVARDTEILTVALALLGECYKLDNRVHTHVDELSQAA
ncbi:MAG: hypothetical protein ABSD59_16765 [Terracidiphilus sp.]|jgi:hypothetical protein